MKGIVLILAIASVAIAQPVTEGSFCESMADCISGCCYNQHCRSKNTCAIFSLAKKKIEKETCAIDT